RGAGLEAGRAEGLLRRGGGEAALVAGQLQGGAVGVGGGPAVEGGRAGVREPEVPGADQRDRAVADDGDGEGRHEQGGGRGLGPEPPGDAGDVNGGREDEDLADLAERGGRAEHPPASDE